MQHTSNYNLNKPDITDYAKIQALNKNADIIDAKLKELDSNKVNSNSMTELQQQLTTHLDKTASLTEIGHTQLSNAIDSTSDVLAATPSAVKQAYDRGSEAFNGLNEVRAEFLAFKAALTEGFTNNQFSDGLTSLSAFNVTAGYYNLPLTRLEV